jgi:hypothetical protein
MSDGQLVLSYTIIIAFHSLTRVHPPQSSRNSRVDVSLGALSPFHGSKLGLECLFAALDLNPVADHLASKGEVISWLYLHRLTKGLAMTVLLPTSRGWHIRCSSSSSSHI